MALEEYILRFLFKMLAYGGGGAVVAYLIFQFLAKNWIENKFAQKLKDFEHEHAKELARLRVEIDSLLSGALKIQEKEFETLPEAWHKLDEVYGRLGNLVSPLQNYPDLDSISLKQLEEFFKESDLYESQKDDIRKTTEKAKKYQEINFWHRLAKIENVFNEFQNYIAHQGIFFPPDLKDKFSKISKELWSALVSKRVGREAKDGKMETEAHKIMEEQVKPLYTTIESEIHARLHAHGRKN